MASFDAINYSLRHNKSVERKIVFDALKEVGRYLDFKKYKFVGLGSLWFVDFLMAHKILGIGDMISIESNEIGHRRAEFNRPLACITCIKGETSTILPTLDLDKHASLVWLDYDSGIGGPVLEDLSITLPSMKSGSIFFVTISAKKDDLPTHNDKDDAIPPEDALREIAGDLVPASIKPNNFQKAKFPELVGEILSNHMQSLILKSGRPEVWLKIIDLVYSDSTPMVTIGGMLVLPEDLEKIQSLTNSKEWIGVQKMPISVPPLTMKEKLSLDRLMPSELSPTDKQMSKLGFPLKREQIDAYHRYYRQYTVFGEFLI